MNRKRRLGQLLKEHEDAITARARQDIEIEASRAQDYRQLQSAHSKAEKYLQSERQREDKTRMEQIRAIQSSLDEDDTSSNNGPAQQINNTINAPAAQSNATVNEGPHSTALVRSNTIISDFVVFEIDESKEYYVFPRCLDKVPIRKIVDNDRQYWLRKWHTASIMIEKAEVSLKDAEQLLDAKQAAVDDRSRNITIAGQERREQQLIDAKKGVDSNRLNLNSTKYFAGWVATLPIHPCQLLGKQYITMRGMMTRSALQHLQQALNRIDMIRMELKIKTTSVDIVRGMFHRTVENLSNEAQKSNREITLKKFLLYLTSSESEWNSAIPRLHDYCQSCRRYERSLLARNVDSEHANDVRAFPVGNEVNGPITVTDPSDSDEEGHVNKKLKLTEEDDDDVEEDSLFVSDDEGTEPQIGQSDSDAIPREEPLSNQEEMAEEPVPEQIMDDGDSLVRSSQRPTIHNRGSEARSANRTGNRSSTRAIPRDFRAPTSNRGSQMRSAASSPDRMSRAGPRNIIAATSSRHPDASSAGPTQNSITSRVAPRTGPALTSIRSETRSATPSQNSLSSRASTRSVLTPTSNIQRETRAVTPSRNPSTSQNAPRGTTAVRRPALGGFWASSNAPPPQIRIERVPLSRDELRRR